MTKKLISMLSIICMAVCFIPATSGVAFAAEGDVIEMDALDVEVGVNIGENIDQVGDSDTVADFDSVDRVGGSAVGRILFVRGVKVLDGNTEYFKGKVKGKGISCKSGGYVKYDSDTNVLTLKNATIQTCNWAFTDANISTCIYYAGIDPSDYLTIEVIGSNTLDGKLIDKEYNSVPLMNGGSSASGVMINGQGKSAKLTCKAAATKNAAESVGLFAPDLALDNVKVYANGGKSQYSCGAYTEGLVYFGEKAGLYGKAGTSTSSNSHGVFLDTNSQQTIPEGCTISGSISSKATVANMAFGVFTAGAIVNNGTLTGSTTGTSKNKYSYAIYCKNLGANTKSKTTATAGTSEGDSIGLIVTNGSSSLLAGTLTAKSGKGSISYGLYSRDGSTPIIVGAEGEKFTLVSPNKTPINVTPSLIGLFGGKTATNTSGKSAKFITNFANTSYLSNQYVQLLPVSIDVKDVAYSKDGVLKAPTVSAKIGKTNASVSVTTGSNTMGSNNVYINSQNTAKVATTGSTSGSYQIKPCGVELTSVTAGKKSMEVAWDKATQYYQGVAGYEVRYSTSSSMKNALDEGIYINSVTSGTLEGLKSGKTYYVQVRSCSYVNGSYVYSPWSKAKKVKVK